MVKVKDYFFDVTITSNSFQDIFPENTVSFFRAKMPTKLMFDRNNPFKVALGKLTFVNSVNNIGMGANTKMWLANNKVFPIEVYFPELSVDDAEGFVNVLSAQLKEARPDIFTNYENVQGFSKPCDKRNVVQETELMMADDERTIETLRDYHSLIANASIDFKVLEEWIDNLFLLLWDLTLSDVDLVLKWRITFGTDAEFKT
jgi:hypothetical protein